MPCEWIKQAVTYTGKASIRQRRLPAEQVVWLVVALALYRHQSIREVVDGLDLALPDAEIPFVSKSAIAQARQRVGSAPLKTLFEISACAWADQDTKQYAFKGLSLYAMDGTTLKTADTPEHREHFGGQVYVSAVSSYPQVRGVTLTAVPTHLIRNAVFGPYGVNEMLYAKEMLSSIPNDSLTAFDKGFLSAEILCGVAGEGQNRHFVIPAKANTKWELIDGTPDDGVIEMRVSPQARKKSPSLPGVWRARAITVIDQQARKHILLTSLLDRKRYKAADIAACLHWAAVTKSQGKLSALLQRLRQRLVAILNEERPGRKFDRAVKALPQRYSVRILKRELN